MIGLAELYWRSKCRRCPLTRWNCFLQANPFWPSDDPWGW